MEILVGDQSSIRLTARQLRLLAIGIRPIIWASGSKLLQLGHDPRSCSCIFCQLHTELIGLAGSIQCDQGNHRRRFRWNILQILLCQLAVRNVSHPTRVLRRAFTSFPSTRRNLALAAKLENARKCAKRMYQRKYGPESYVRFRSIWTAYLECLRHWLSARRPWHLRKGKSGIPRHETVLVDALVGAVTPLLAGCHAEPPAPEQIRKLARLFLRYVRRGRLNLSIRDCISDQTTVASRLADFMLTRLHKTNINRKVKENVHGSTQG